jgi:CubicO group peptidase (beta-lactamase class C family)
MSTQTRIFDIKKTPAASMTILWILVLLFSTFESSLAEGNSISSGGNAAVPLHQGPSDPAELQTFLDQLLGMEMKEQHIAGAAVSVVKDGKLFFAKGYGYADIEKGIPVDPAQTLFRIGSVTKLFTWTAVMQLVEQGKLDLDADINTYLDFRIPDTYPQPITLRHLLTHTAGFEERLADMVTLHETEIEPEGQWLVSHIPARVRPPGEMAAYSNYGTALAGYIVERVSGQPYDDYIQEHILNPLGMENSQYVGMENSSAQGHTPLSLRAQESVGYMYNDSGFQAFPRLFTPVDLLPIGAMEATVADMARFMIAHLQDGRHSDAALPEARILEEATARQMHSTLYTPDPRILGTTYGFFDFSDNGQRVIGHSGEAEPMESLLLLLPDQNLGIFVAYNSLGANALIHQHLGFQRAFFDHYYPASPVGAIRSPVDFARQADRFAGEYRVTRHSYTTLEKYMALLSPTVYVKNPRDGTLLLETPYGDWRIVEQEPLYFRQVDRPYHFIFREDDQGRITQLFTDYTPMMAFEKVRWYEAVSFNMPLLLASLMLFLSVLLVAPIRAIRNRRRNVHQESAPRGANVAHRIILAICLLNLLFMVGNVLWGEQIAFGIPFVYKILLGLGVLSAVLTVAAVVYCVVSWKERYWRIGLRAYYTLVTVAAIAFVWFLNYWNLLGWRF